MSGGVFAVLATSIYVVAFSFFKVAADHSKPLYGSRPGPLVRETLSQWQWSVGLVILLIGVPVQITALSMISLSVAMPVFVVSLVLLVAISLVYFGEHVSTREWVGLSLIAVAVLLIALSVGRTAVSADMSASTERLLAVLVPSLVLPVLLFAAGRTPEGRHARPLAGISYGFSLGVLYGTAELAIKGMADLYRAGEGPGAILATPYPYVMLLAVVPAFALGQIAVQRCRIVIVITVGMTVSKLHLLLMGSILYGEPWPDDPTRTLLRLAGFAVAVLGVALFPRHDRRPTGLSGHSRRTGRHYAADQPPAR